MFILKKGSFNISYLIKKENIFLRVLKKIYFQYIIQENTEMLNFRKKMEETNEK